MKCRECNGQTQRKKTAGEAEVPPVSQLSKPGLGIWANKRWLGIVRNDVRNKHSSVRVLVMAVSRWVWRKRAPQQKRVKPEPHPLQVLLNLLL